MPIYEYRCSACGHRTEILHGINDDGPRFCPACGAEGKLRKAITAPSIVFKGSGWAKKDRRPAPASSKAKAAGDGEAGSTAGKSTDSASGGPAAPDSSGPSDSSGSSGSSKSSKSSGESRSSGDSGGD
jgi:putative FmdB family regulatory protein